MDARYVLVLPDGAADEPVPELGGKTPLEAADIPNMDAVASRGRIGTVRTVPEGFLPGSDVATMSLLGYDVRRHYSGRAPIEAVARNVSVGRGDVVFRCNFVTIENGDMADFTAGHISTDESRRLVASLNDELGESGLRFHAGVSYRNLLVISDPETLEAVCAPPHDIPGEIASDYLPKGRGGRRLREIMERGAEIVSRHEVNRARQQRGEPPATDIWLWGQGLVPILPRFRQRFGVRGAVIAAVDLIRGLGKLVGWPIVEVPGATGYIDTDYGAKGRAAAAALDEYELVAVHIEAPDEAGHQGDAAAKVRALEEIDDKIVGPLLDKLQTFDRWRILIAPDHPTPVRLKTHTSTPPPFALMGADVVQGVSAAAAFSEAAAAASDFHVVAGHELMDYFLRR